MYIVRYAKAIEQWYRLFSFRSMSTQLHFFNWFICELIRNTNFSSVSLVRLHKNIENVFIHHKLICCHVLCIEKHVDVIMHLLIFYEWRKAKRMLVRFYSGWFSMEVLSIKNPSTNYSLYWHMTWYSFCESVEYSFSNSLSKYICILLTRVRKIGLEHVNFV